MGYIGGFPSFPYEALPGSLTGLLSHTLHTRYVLSKTGVAIFFIHVQMNSIETGNDFLLNMNMINLIMFECAIFI